LLGWWRKSKFTFDTLLGPMETDGDSADRTIEYRSGFLVAQLLPKDETEDLSVSRAQIRDDRPQSVTEWVMVDLGFENWLGSDAGIETTPPPTTPSVFGKHTPRDAV
jgi:hypothetical protein